MGLVGGQPSPKISKKPVGGGRGGGKSKRVLLPVPVEKFIAYKALEKDCFSPFLKYHLSSDDYPVFHNKI